MINWAIEKVAGSLAGIVGNAANRQYDKMMQKVKRDIYKTILGAFLLAISIAFLLVGLVLLFADVVPVEYSLIFLGIVLLVISLLGFKQD